MNSFESLQERNVLIEKDSEPVFENIDEFIMSGEGERPWQVFELTQNQNVIAWIKNPDAIELIQPVLTDLSERLTQHPSPLRILDVGCYGGYVFDYIKTISANWKTSFEYTGVDVQKRVIRDARLAHLDDERATFQEGDLFHLSQQFPANSFDVAVCYRVLHHLPHFQDCVHELSIVSKNYVHTALPLRDRSSCVRMRETNRETGEIVYSFYRYFCRNEIMDTADELGLQAKIISYPNKPYSTVLFIPKAGA
jgi:SAM-dependent methyltransferase